MLEVLLSLLIGLALIYAEFYVPGGILATVGTMAIVLSFVLILDDLKNFYYLIPYAVVVLLALYVTIKVALWRIQKNEDFYLGANQESFSASGFKSELMGKKAVTVTALRPSGYISIAGERYVASSTEGFIEPGEPVKVIGGEGGSLWVRHLHDGQEEEA